VRRLGAHPGSAVVSQAPRPLSLVTTVSASEEDCDLTTGAGCTMPPQGPGDFYPYWTQAWDRELGCTWQFGNVRRGNTFGGEAQYGVVDPTTMGGFASEIMRNPSCRPAGTPRYGRPGSGSAVAATARRARGPGAPGPWPTSGRPAAARTSIAV